MTALMESAKRKMGGDKDSTSQDGGQYPSVYEVGSTLELTPIERDPDLVGYWKLDEGSGNITDSSGNGNSGTPFGSLTYGESGKMGSAIRFTTSSDYFSIPYSINSFAMESGQDKTWLFWAKRNAIIGSASELALSDGALGIYFRDNGAYGGLMVVTTGAIQYTKTRVSGVLSTINDLQWHHYAMVWNRNGNLEIFMNGSPVSITTVKDLSDGYSEDWSSAGTERTIGRIQGNLDEIRVYNRTLSASEIQAIYNATR